MIQDKNEKLNWGQSKLNNNNMIDEIMKKYSHLEEAYDSKESMKEHFLSGEVTMPIKDAVEIGEHSFPDVKPLVSFGNYLLNKCKVKGHDLDGEACFDRQVTHADLYNWREANPGILNQKETTLPSKYQINDNVRLDFFDAGFVKNCTVIKVHFTDSKVLYDVDVTIGTDVNGKPNKTRLYNIDSCFLVD